VIPSLNNCFAFLIQGYAFEIDEPAVERILTNTPFRTFTYNIVTVCRKDSTEIEQSDRDKLVSAIFHAQGDRVVVTHGTDTMIETAAFCASKGVCDDKCVIFTGAMKPERFYDSDAAFNVGASIGALSVLQVYVYAFYLLNLQLFYPYVSYGHVHLQSGLTHTIQTLLKSIKCFLYFHNILINKTYNTVPQQAGAFVCMGGRVMHHARCWRDTKSGLFLEKDDNLDMAVDAECGKVLRDVKGLFT